MGPAGSNATSGSWRIESINEDTARRTSTWKVSGDEVSMSTPTGESWMAKFDGGESPVKGVYANETVSVKKMGERAIEVTYKRDGKLYSEAGREPSVRRSATKPDSIYCAYIDERTRA